MSASPTTPARRWAGAGPRWTASGSMCPAAPRPIQVSVLMNAIPARVAGVARIVMVTPASGGKINPLVLAAAQAGGGQRNLPHRRRAGGGGAGLWHADIARGGQDRRPRQRLCRGRQARSVRPGRHRFHRRAVGNSGHRRRPATIRNGSPPICSARPSMTPRRKAS